MKKIITGCETEKGNFREKNQDRVLCMKHRQKGESYALACICDGIGSFRNSEIASQIVIDKLRAWFAKIQVYAAEFTEEEICEDLAGTIHQINELVFSYQKRQGEQIGCTMSLLFAVGGEYHIFHVGDSRIYDIGESVSLLTKDQIKIQEKNGRMHSYLTNYIGKNRELSYEERQGILSHKNYFLLGSDGIYRRLQYKDVAYCKRQMHSDRQAQKTARVLIDSVLKRGERDNVSVVLLLIQL